MAEKGRKEDSREFTNTIGDKSGAQAILEKQDEIIDAIKALTAKMDADFADVVNASVDYASAISDAIDKVVLK